MSADSAVSLDGHSECGYTKATSDTCASFMKTLKYSTLSLIVVYIGTAALYTANVHVVNKHITCTTVSHIDGASSYNASVGWLM